MSGNEGWDLPTHLRATYFALIAVSVSLLFAGLADTSEDLGRSLNDVRTIGEIYRTQASSSDADLWEFHKYVKDQIDAPGLSMTPIGQLTLEDPPYSTWRVELAKSSWSDYWYGGVPDLHVRERAALTPYGHTPRLADFKLYWDGLRESTYILVPREIEPFIMVRGYGPEPNRWEKVRWGKPSSEAPGATLRVFEFDCGHGHEPIFRQDDISFDCGYRAVISADSSEQRTRAPQMRPAHTAFLPVTLMQPMRLDAQGGFFEYFRKRNLAQGWRRGRFAESFGQLDRMTANIQYLNVDDIEKVLENERERNQGQLELLNLKLPSNMLRTLGVIVMAIVQLYFFPQLRELNRRVAIGDVCDTAWIAFYPGRPAQLYFLGSLFLPVLAMGALTWKWFRTTHDVLAGTMLFLVIALLVVTFTSIGCLRLGLSIRRKLVLTPPALITV